MIFGGSTKNAWQTEHSTGPVPANVLAVENVPSIVDYERSHICADTAITATHRGSLVLQSKEQMDLVAQEILSKVRI